MQITSTQFQQRVGYYLDKAAQGNDLIIIKSKPKMTKMKVTVKELRMSRPKKAKKNNRIQEILKFIDNSNLEFNFKGSGLEYQNKVRS